MLTESSTSKMLYKTRTCLANNLKKKYGIEKEETIDNILRIHGLHKDNFDFIKNIETIINNQLNDVSIDSNSNKNEKTIEGINQECFAASKKAIGYDYLFRTMKDLYGETEANRLMGEMLDFSLGLADSTNILKPYCYALDASKIVTIGRDFGQLHSKPSKRVSSYISALCETVHQMSSHLAGALAIGSLFLDIGHLCIYKEKIDARDLKTSKKVRKTIENEFQQFVHSVNHISRNNESPFTNISLFDRIKLRKLIEDMNWYFPFDELDINIPKSLETEEEKNNYCYDYIVEYIMELQDIFLDFFDKGDPSKNGLQYRFPVVTINLSKKKWGDRLLIEDEKFLRNICRREVYRYNIFVSEGNRVASCCRLLSDTDMLEYAAHVNGFGGSGISLGSHRVVTINFMRLALEAKSAEEFYKIFDQRIVDCAKILKSHKELIKKLEKQGLQPFIKNGWINMNRLFSTIGILGIYEAAKLYKEKFGNGKDVEGEMLIFLNNRSKELSLEYKISINLEQIPGESFAIRLADSDKEIFGKEKIPYEMYSNQWCPLWEDVTIWEKMEIDGKYNKLITGGGIVHTTIGEKVTSIQAEKIIRFAVNSGCEHQALNAIYSICEKGHVLFGKKEICDDCKGKITDWMTRVVGFFTPVSSWNKTRREWEFPKRTLVNLNEEEK